MSFKKLNPNKIQNLQKQLVDVTIRVSQKDSIFMWY